jgi:RHS repeat-associated protein
MNGHGKGVAGIRGRQIKEIGGDQRGRERRESLMRRNDLVGKIKYPDLSTGSASTSAANDETYTYNALGQQKTYLDRDGSTHAYSYDVLGRLVSDVIPTGDLGSGVSNQTLALGYSYNDAGLPFKQTSYSNSAMTTVENQDEDVYNGYGQLTIEYQETSGAVNTSTSASVQYAYSQPTGTNYSRMVSMTYPNGRLLDYGYNSGIDTTISRVSYLKDDGGSSAGVHLADYLYLGLGTIVQQNSPEANTELTYIHQTGDTLSSSDGGDRYTGLDRFGRVIDQYYLNTSTGTATDRLQYGYDRDGNVLYEKNLVNGAFSELYHASSSTSGDNNTAYDSLNRLTTFRRGTLTSSGNNGSSLDTITTGNLNSTTGVPNTNSWTLDALGNQTSAGGTTGTFNSQNEQTASGSTSLTYDNAGNMTTDESGNTYTYDAWGHAISIVNGSSTTALHYDALGRNVVFNNGAGNDQQYYSQQRQVVEEKFSGAYEQYVWGLTYVNDLVLRDRDADGNGSTGNLGITGSGLEEREYFQHNANWSTISYTNQTGTVGQRFVYDPYGTVTTLDNSWAVSTATSNFTTYLFQGMRVLGGYIYLSQSRLYDVKLGRWISQDPAQYINGSNEYQAELSNPISLADPTGLDAGSAVIGGGAAAGTAGWLDWLIGAGEVAGGSAAAVGGAAFGFYYIHEHWVGPPPSANQIAGLPQPMVIPPSTMGGAYGRMYYDYRVQQEYFTQQAANNPATGSQSGCPSEKSKPQQSATQPSGPTPSIPHPGNIPRSQSPGPDWEWKGQPPAGGKQGNWYNPKTGESLYNDMNSEQHDPHWDYRLKGEDGKWRWYPDGRMERQT